MTDSTVSQSIEHRRTAVADWLKTGSINLFGLPFAGKDTQAHLLSAWLGAPIISGGDILRSSTIPDRVQAILDKGGLIPTKDYLKIITPYLGQSRFAGSPLLLSAVGRWQGEEKSILRAAADAGHPTRAVIYLTLDLPLVRQRWATLQAEDNRGSRADDSAEALELRLEEFLNKTVPVLDFYRQQGLLIEVDGSDTPKNVQLSILNSLYERANA